MMIATDRTWVYLYTMVTNTPTLVEKLYNPHDGWVTYSFQGEHVSAWCGNRLLASFLISTNNRARAKLGSTAVGAVDYEWRELDYRVDNFVMEMGQDGLIIFNEIARESRAFLQDTQYGELRLFRNRTEINVIGSPYDIVYDSTVMKSDAGLATRVRLIGIEEIEIPMDAIDTYGDVFQMINLDRANDVQEMMEFWPYIKEDLDLKYEPRSAFAAFNPELEPNDIMYVISAHPSGVITEKLYVDNVSVNLRVTNTDAELDMNVSGYV